MKSLKFNHHSAQEVLAGKKRSTWRLYDDKDLAIDDEILIVDKVEPHITDTWRIIGQARIATIIQKKLGDITNTEMVHENPSFTSMESMLKTYQGYYGKRVGLDTPVKIVSFTEFVPRSEPTPVAGVILPEAKLYTDGGSRGNPGHSACAYVICNMDGSVVEKSGFFIGRTTNNQAEYQGLIRGLRRTRDLGVKKLSVFMDSELVINQAKGLYKVKNLDLGPLKSEVDGLAAAFDKITFTHVPRELNKPADSEVNRILDEHEGAI